jgi:hypothetical protein
MDHSVGMTRSDGSGNHLSNGSDTVLFNEVDYKIITHCIFSKAIARKVLNCQASSNHFQHRQPLLVTRRICDRINILYITEKHEALMVSQQFAYRYNNPHLMQLIETFSYMVLGTFFDKIENWSFC